MKTQQNLTVKKKKKTTNLEFNETGQSNITDVVQKTIQTKTKQNKVKLSKREMKIKNKTKNR